MGVLQGVDLLQGLTMALLVLAALAGTVLFLQRKGWARVSGLTGARGKARRLEAVERLVLTPQHSLHLVRFEGRLMLVSSAPGGCNIVDLKPINLHAVDLQANL